MHATKSNVTVKFLTPTSRSAAEPVSLQCRCVVYFIVIENTNLRKRERGIPHQANWYTRHLLGWLKVRKGTPPTSARYLASGDSAVPVSVLYRQVITVDTVNRAPGSLDSLVLTVGSSVVLVWTGIPFFSTLGHHQLWLLWSSWSNLSVVEWSSGLVSS